MLHSFAKEDVRCLFDETAEVVFVTYTPGGLVVCPELDNCVIDNAPAMTLVFVYFRPEKGSFIRVLVALPDQWNGRFLGLGNGGGAGGVGVDCDRVRQGYAVAHTDMGTSLPSPAESGIGNPAVWKDFGWRSTQIMTIAGKRITEAYYGRKPKTCIFYGESTGGQQAMSMAQRCPEEYDAILAGVPAHCRAPLHAYFLWNDQALYRSDGIPLFTEEQEQRYRKCVLQYFSDREVYPPAKQHFISEPRWNEADKAAVLKLASENDPSLTREHLAALKKLQDGPVHARTGKRIYCGMPPASPFRGGFSKPFSCKGTNLYLFYWVFGKNTDLLKLDFDKDIDRYLTTLGPYLNAEDTDLSAFRKHGGKLILFSGTSDSCVPYHASMDYYERLVEKTGSLSETQEFCRFFIIPGREHGGGPGAWYLRNVLEELIRWKEEGIAPDCLQGIRTGKHGLVLNVYPYPACADEHGNRMEGPRLGIDRISSDFL